MSATLAAASERKGKGMTIEFTSIAKRLESGTAVTALGLALCIVRIGGQYELQIRRGTDVRTESYETRAQAWARAEAMMGRVES
jgi:hypothetical protein